MSNPELRLIQGEDSPINRFKSFVISHSFRLENDVDILRSGTYSLNDPDQLVPVDKVEFKLMDVDGDGSHSYSINLSRHDTRESLKVYKVWYDDNPEEPTFYDEAVIAINETEAERIIDKLSRAEEAGRLILMY